MNELKKRILVKAEQHCRHIEELTPELNKIMGKAAEKSVTVHINTENMTVKMWDVFHIVEEMQKEFPKIKETNTSNMSWEQIARAMEQKTLERKAWFEKWFSKGDVST